MSRLDVTSTEFRSRPGRYLDEAGRRPVFITQDEGPVRVLLDIDEYERLKRHDTRRAMHPADLPDHLKDELEKGWRGEPTPELDHLLR